MKCVNVGDTLEIIHPQRGYFNPIRMGILIESFLIEIKIMQVVAAVTMSSSVFLHFVVTL